MPNPSISDALQSLREASILSSVCSLPWETPSSLDSRPSVDYLRQGRVSKRVKTEKATRSKSVLGICHVLIKITVNSFDPQSSSTLKNCVSTQLK